jgi:hypothetical protein
MTHMSKTKLKTEMKIGIESDSKKERIENFTQFF